MILIDHIVQTNIHNQCFSPLHSPVRSLHHTPPPPSSPLKYPSQISQEQILDRNDLAPVFSTISESAIYESHGTTTDFEASPRLAPASPTKSQPVTYSKQIQTMDTWTEEPQMDIEELRAKIRAEVEEEYRQKLLEKESELQNSTSKSSKKESQLLDDDPFEVEVITQKVNNLNLNQKDQQEISKFLSQSIKVVSRALDSSAANTSYDITIDYSENDSNADAQQNFGPGGNPVRQIAQFFCPETVAGRAVTDIDWSPKYPELLAVSYTEKRASTPGFASSNTGTSGYGINFKLNPPEGLVHVWNMYSRSRPEYTFTCSSDVLRIRFSPTDPHLLFGTCYNGQVVAWNLKSNDHLPILISALNGSSHLHPVFGMQFIGTANSSTNINNPAIISNKNGNSSNSNCYLMTASTDGTVCTWTPDILETPQDKLLLTVSNIPIGSPNPSGTGNRTSSSSGTRSILSRIEDVSPTCLAICNNDTPRFVVGTEEGTIYQCLRFGQAGTKAGIDPRGSFSSHVAPVTSMNFHASSSVLNPFSDSMASSNHFGLNIPKSTLGELGNLLLSCSLDWSIKLWKVKPFSGPSISSSSGKPETTHQSSSSSLGQGSPSLTGSPFGNSVGGGTGNQYSLEPLLDFARDYEVYDVQWSAYHPSIFASVDGSGHLEIWDLLKDLEAPVCRVKPTTYQSINDVAGNISGNSEGNNNNNDIKKQQQQQLRGSRDGTTTTGTDILSRPLNRVSWNKTFVQPSPSLFPISNSSTARIDEEQQQASATNASTTSIPATLEDEDDVSFSSHHDANTSSQQIQPDSATTNNNNPHGHHVNFARRVAVGSLDGIVSVFELDQEFFPVAKPADWLALEKTLYY